MLPIWPESPQDHPEQFVRNRKSRLWTLPLQDDAAELPSLPTQRGAAMVECDRLQPGEPVAAAGAAQKDRSLVADQLATEVGEDGRALSEACALPLAAVGGRSSDAAGVRGDFADDLGSAPTDWIGRGGREGNRWKEGGWDGEVSEKSLAMKPLRPFFVPEGGRAGPFPRPSESRGMKNSQRPAPAEAVGCIIIRYEKPKRKFRLNVLFRFSWQPEVSG